VLGYNGGMEISDLFTDPVAFATLVLAFVTVFLAVGTFLTIRQNDKFRKEERKFQAKLRIRTWAEDAIKRLSTGGPPDFGVEAVKNNMQIIRAGSLSVLTDVKLCNKEINDSVAKAVYRFNEFTDKAEKMDEKTDFQNMFNNLLGYLNTVIQSTSKY
jgi:hypothetical protein